MAPVLAATTAITGVSKIVDGVSSVWKQHGSSSKAHAAKPGSFASLLQGNGADAGKPLHDMAQKLSDALVSTPGSGATGSVNKVV